MTMPASWEDIGLTGFTGRVRFRRRFGYPGQIDAHERVWLTLTGVTAGIAVWLNGTPLALAVAGILECDVTALLQPRNVLDLVLESYVVDAGPWMEIALEIRCTAYLQGVQARREGKRVCVGGLVVGTAERDLELYLLADRHTLAYATVEADPAGKPFELVGDLEAQAPSPTLRVELVNVATVWYGLALACPEPVGGVAPCTPPGQA
jgi:hypothetical protein